MSLSSTTNRIDYVGNNSTDTYAYTFRIFAQTDLLVTIRDTDNVEATQVLTTDYTVTGVGDEGGGNIVLVDGNLATSYVLTIRRVRPLTQGADIRNQGDFFPETHEDAFDHFVMIDQQQQDTINRSFRLPETIASSDVDTTLPIPVAGRTIGWNDDEDGLVNFANAGELAVSSYIESLLDDADAATARATLGFSGSGGTVASAQIENGAVIPSKLGSASLGSIGLFNYSLTASVAANALTISFKTAAGTDPSSSDPSKLVFRSTTATTGTPNAISVTSAVSSLVISSGSTLGQTDALPQYVYVYAMLDNSSNVVLAASSSLFSEGSLRSSTAEGGGGAADSANALYSASSLTSKPIRLLGRILTTQTTAGTWAASPAEISLVPFVSVKRRATIHKVSTTYTAAISDEVILCDATSGAFTVTLPAAASSRDVVLKFKKIDSTFSLVTIDGNASETIDGAVTTTLATQYETLEISCDGANWHILERKSNSSWATFLPTWASTGTQPTIGNGTLSSRYRRVGDSIEIDFYVLIGSTTSAGTGNYTLSLPTGLTIDTTKLAGDVVGTNRVLGVSAISDSGTAEYLARVAYSTTTAFAFNQFVVSGGGVVSGGDWSATSPMTPATGDEVFARLVVPIVGWRA